MAIRGKYRWWGYRTPPSNLVKRFAFHRPPRKVRSVQKLTDTYKNATYQKGYIPNGRLRGLSPPVQRAFLKIAFFVYVVFCGVSVSRRILLHYGFTRCAEPQVRRNCSAFAPQLCRNCAALVALHNGYTRSAEEFCEVTHQITHAHTHTRAGSYECQYCDDW